MPCISGTLTTASRVQDSLASPIPAMEVIMDPFTFELLSGPPLPGALQMEGPAEAELDAYLRAIGVLPPFLAPAGFAPASLDQYSAAALDAYVELPATWELYAPALDDHLVKPAIDVVPVPITWPPERAVPVSDVAASKNSATRRRLSDYDADIDFNLREMEKKATERPSPDYLKTVQGDRMSPSTRANLVGWMDAFIRYYDLAPGTLHRAVAYVDRVLSVKTLTAHGEYELRLLGAAAAFTAAKYEDQRTRLKLNAVNIAWYCGFTTSEEVLDMERNMVLALNYQLGGPTAYTFVDHFTRYSDGEEELQVQRLAHQLAETSLVDYRCLELMPSAVAAAAVFLARLALTPPAGQVQKWNKDFEELTGYNPMDLIHGVQSMYMLHPDPRFLIFPAFLQDL